jgi:hypothetical protein
MATVAAISVASPAVATCATIAARATGSACATITACATVSGRTAVAASAPVPAGSTSATVTTRATDPTRAAVITSAAGTACAAIAAGAARAAGSRVATICNSAATTRASSVIDATRRTNRRISRAWTDSRIATDRAGHGIGPIPVAGPIIHSAQSLGKDGAAADFLTPHDMKAAVAVHGWIGNSRYALGGRPKVLGRGRGADSEEEGCARQSKSVRALHVFTYIIS